MTKLTYDEVTNTFEEALSNAQSDFLIDTTCLPFINKG